MTFFSFSGERTCKYTRIEEKKIVQILKLTFVSYTTDTKYSPEVQKKAFMGVELQPNISVDIYTYELNIIHQNYYKMVNKSILSLYEQNN